MLCVRALGRLERQLGKGAWRVPQRSATERERDHLKRERRLRHFQAALMLSVSD